MMNRDFLLAKYYIIHLFLKYPYTRKPKNIHKISLNFWTVSKKLICIKWSNTHEGSNKEKPIQCQPFCQMLLKKWQFRNRWLADSEAPHLLTQSWESWSRMHHLNILSLVESRFMRRRQATTYTFNGMSLCQRSSATRIWTWGIDWTNDW